MTVRLTQREALARLFPSYDRELADRAIAWLDYCGYQLVEKAPLARPEPAHDNRMMADLH